MSLLRAQLRQLVTLQLQAACTGVVVVQNRALPTDATALPIIVVTTPAERKESRGPGAPKFLTTVHLMADIFAVGTTDDALDRLEVLMEQVEMTVLANAMVTRQVQEFVAVESHAEMSALGGDPVARGRIMFQTKLPQVFDPAMPDRLLEIDIFRDPAMTERFEKITLPQ